METKQEIPDFLEQYKPEGEEAEHLKFEEDSDFEDGGEEAGGEAWGGGDDNDGSDADAGEAWGGGGDDDKKSEAAEKDGW
jgi:ATP-dependent RNA helicase DDX3X